MTVEDPMFARIAKFTDRDETGATAVEYGLMVALIAIAIIAAVTLLGTNLSDLFDNVAGQVAAP
jgi:pilus assembly protein Flp/PilA